MSQFYVDEKCFKCGKNTLTIDSGLDYHSESCSSCGYEHFEDYWEINAPQLKKGVFVVLKENVVDEHDYECPLFKIEDVLDSEKVRVKELSSELSKDGESLVLSISDLEPVNITPLTLFRNYVINNSIVDGNWDCLSGEDVCGIKILRTIDYRSRDMSEFLSKIEDAIPSFLESRECKIDLNSLGKSKSLFDEKQGNLLFNQARDIYVDKFKYLNALNTDMLVKEYLFGGRAYRFTDVSIDNNNYSKTMIEDAFNAKVC